MSKRHKIEPIPTSDGTYRVRWNDNGKRRSKNFKKKTLADVFCKKLNRGEPIVEEEKIVNNKLNYKFKKLANVFFKNHVKVNSSPSTIRNYEMYLRIHVLPFFGEIILKDLHLTHLDSFTAKIKSKKRTRGKKDRTVKVVDKTKIGKKVGLSEKMQRELQSLVLRIAKYGYERDYLEQDPFKRFKLKKLKAKKQEYFTGKEVEKFLSWCEAGGPYVPDSKNKGPDGKQIIKLTENIERDTEIFKFALHTGARQGEILGLKRKAVDFSNRLVWFNAIYDMSVNEMAERTKGGNVRCIEMDDLVYDMMLKRKDLNPEELIFGEIKEPMWKNTFYVY